jgi:hypothetical protein
MSMWARPATPTGGWLGPHALVGWPKQSHFIFFFSLQFKFVLV